jgi:pimeloyl-ACP methyl ester carboxylesterase
MPTALVNGVNIYYEETGSGFPVVFAHEFAGDYRSWEGQVRYFSRRYRCVTYNARGYPPSDVPSRPSDYSQTHSVEDLYGLRRSLGIDKAYIVGLSMGGATAVNFAIAHPEATAALVPCGTGSGSDAGQRVDWITQMGQNAALMESQGLAAVTEGYGHSPNRMQYLRKDPRGWQEFYRQFSDHSAIGSAMTIRNTLLKRPTVYQLESQMKALRAPTLVMVGDEDTACIEPSLFMKRSIPGAGLLVFPNSGHLINLEEPEMFNHHLASFLSIVESGRWF